MQGRKVLVLTERTERTEHLEAIRLALTAQVPPPFVLYGRISKKQRAICIAELDALGPQAPHILLATGNACWRGLRSHCAGYVGVGHANFLERHLAAVRRPFAQRARRQNRRKGHRLRGHRPSGLATYVGETPARPSRDGLSNGMLERQLW